MSSDIRADIRKWIATAIETHDADLVTLLGDRIVDAQTLAPEDLPLIWFRRSGVIMDPGCSDGPNAIAGVDVLMEFCGDSAQIGLVQRLETAVLCAYRAFNPNGTNFGDRHVQLVELDNVDDNYQPYVAGTIEGVYWTALSLKVYF